MKKTNTTRIISLILVLISIVSTVSIAAVSTSAEVTSDTVSVKTYEDILKDSISTYIGGKIPDPLKPLFGLLSEDITGGYGSDDSNPFDEIDSKLDDLRKEMSAEFDKVLSEMDKNNKMRNAVDALAKAEFIADTIMENSHEEMENEIFSSGNNLTPSQQKKAVQSSSIPHVQPGLNLDGALYSVTIAKGKLWTTYAMNLKMKTHT